MYLRNSYVIAGGFFTNIIGNSNDDGVAIKNLGITNSFFSDGGNAAAFAGRVDGKVSIENCFSTSTIKGNGGTAGLVGLVYTQSELTIKNSFNAGVINGWRNSETGGLIGWINPNAKAAVFNSYNLDSLSSGLGNLLNANYDTSYTIEHSYHISFDTSADTTTRKGTGATPIQFADGTIAKALHDYNENGVDGSVWDRMSVLTLTQSYPEKSPSRATRLYHRHRLLRQRKVPVPTRNQVPQPRKKVPVPNSLSP